MTINIPTKVKMIIDKYYESGFEAFMVGGCVRDALLGRTPEDYDITTSALPNITESLFKKTIPTGIQHGTVTVIIEGENYEVTTYRTEGRYLDNRHPSDVQFVTNIKEDLARRDFTINAFAYNDKAGLIDYFNGFEDLNNQIIRAVGDADKRFQEDALRMLRAIRFSCQLGFSIEPSTLKAIKTNAELIKNISMERIRDEFCKILISPNAVKGIELLNETGILAIILPEITALINYTPLCNNHNNNVYEHTLNVLNNTKDDLLLRLSALFHDIGKIKTLTQLPNGHYYFPGHSEAGADMVVPILKRFKFDNNTINSVSVIIRYHLVLYPDQMPSDGDIKRLLNNVGIKNINTLFNLQRADINSLWNPVPFLAKVDYIDKKVNSFIAEGEPLTIKDLAVNGSILVSELNIQPGKILGEILNYLLEQVLDNKDINTKEQLLCLAREYLSKKML